MQRAGEIPRAGARLASNELTPMAADRAHRVDCSILETNDDQLLTRNHGGQIVTGLRNLVLMPYTNPGTRKHSIPLELKKFRRCIAFARQHRRHCFVTREIWKSI